MTSTLPIRLDPEGQAEIVDGIRGARERDNAQELLLSVAAAIEAHMAENVAALVPEADLPTAVGKVNDLIAALVLSGLMAPPPGPPE